MEKREQPDPRKHTDSGIERRMYERISLPIKLKYEVKNRPHLVRESVSKNISGGGICISLQEKLLPSTELKIRVEIGTSDVINLTGRVAWTRRVEVEDDVGTMVYYDTGIEFIDADPINVNRIITHFYGKSF